MKMKEHGSCPERACDFQIFTNGEEKMGVPSVTRLGAQGQGDAAHLNCCKAPVPIRPLHVKSLLDLLGHTVGH